MTSNAFATQRDLQCFYGNVCQGCNEQITQRSLSQAGRPIYVDLRQPVPRIKYCAFCTVYHALHNAAYLGPNSYQVRPNGMPANEQSARLLVRLLDAQHDFNDPFDPRSGCIVQLPSQ